MQSGREHRSLRPDMLELKELCHSKPYLLYTECGSKNNPGGLRERKVKNKTVKVCLWSVVISPAMMSQGRAATSCGLPQL